MSGKEIRVVAGDRGGWNALEPPLIKALDAGCEVTVYFVGTCAGQYRSRSLELDGRLRVVTGYQMTPENFVAEPHDLTVLGASQSEEGAKAAADAAINSCTPVLAVEDMYGSFLPSFQLIDQAGELHKMTVCVTDSFSCHFLLRCNSRFSDCVVVTGGPQFDKILEIKNNWQEQRQQLRRAMDVDHDELVFLIAGQLNGTSEVVMLVRETALKQKYRMRMVVRQHPRATWLDYALLERCCAAIPRSYFVDTPHTFGVSSEKVLAGVDFVLSGYSTINYYGILYEMPGVVYVGTPSFRWDLWHEKGLGKPPEVGAGAAWYVETPDDLAHVVEEVRKGDASEELQKIRQAQQRIAEYNDGHAADRVWAEMQKLMGG